MLPRALESPFGLFPSGILRSEIFRILTAVSDSFRVRMHTTHKLQIPLREALERSPRNTTVLLALRALAPAKEIVGFTERRSRRFLEREGLGVPRLTVLEHRPYRG